MGILEGFVYGVFGGFLAELLGLFKLRHQTPGSFPDWIRSRFYWTVTVLMILAGGGLVVVYLKSAFALKPLIALNIGASAPLIIGSIVSQTPRPPVGRVD